MVMPLDLGMRIPGDDSLRVMLEITQRLDYGKLYRTYQRPSHRADATPRQMLELILLGSMDADISTRALEKSCRYDIRYQYILAGKRVPDHSRFARFMREHLTDEVAEDLFYQMVLYLHELGEIGFENLFVDGTKMEANANRYSFVWAKTVGKHQARLEEKIQAFLREMTVAYPHCVEDGATLSGALRSLETQAAAEGIEFVHGKGTRKTPLQRAIETARAHLEKLRKYKEYRDTFQGRKSFSKTDTDATFMRMKEDHMQNGQLKPGYNLVLGTEAEYIVGVHLSPERSDTLTLLPLLARIEAGSRCRHKAVIADAGFESEENYTALEAAGQIAYFKPLNYEKSKRRSFRKNPYLRENMPYDAEKDAYQCPGGHQLEATYTKIRTSNSGFEVEVTVYTCSHCVGCPHKPNCTKAQENRKMEVSKCFDRQRQASLARIKTSQGILLRVNRSIQAEGAFGVLKEDCGIRRFLRRGMPHVFMESLLLAMGRNVNKLDAKRKQNRAGVWLHQLDSA